MGNFGFSKLFRRALLAAVALAAGFLAVAAAANPAAAQDGNGGNGNEQRLWDTDNLKFPGYTAKSFAIPHYGRQGD